MDKKNSQEPLQAFTHSVKILLSYGVEKARYLLKDRQYDPPKKPIEILKKLGTNSTEHLNKRSLYSHLLGTYRILKKWNAPEQVCLAGLYHSIYGTYNYRKCVVNLEQRDIIEDAIGVDAEKLVYYYCLEDRNHFSSNFERINEFKLRTWLGKKEMSLTQEEFSALITIRLADHLEQLPYTRDYCHQEFYLKSKPFLTEKAFDDFLIAYDPAVLNQL
ncbi:MAG: DUF6817 domain-containing protein [Prochlorotrichaceae cyanobacterium]|jgi:hypothetical protein